VIVDPRTAERIAYLAGGVAIGSNNLVKGLFVACVLLAASGLAGIVQRRLGS
jgi:hypothetical protein